MKNYSKYNFIHEAILYEDCNRDEIPSIKHPFYIKVLVPLESEVGSTISAKRNNIMNKDVTMLSTQNMLSEVTIDLYIPRYLLLDYPEDVIPKGTKFLVCFVGGNINNIQIIGRCYQ